VIDFVLDDEHRDIRNTVRAFVRKELVPLEDDLIRREKLGGPGQPTRAEMYELQQKARRSGLWGVDTPEEYGGADLSKVIQALINEELGRTIFDFRFGGSAHPMLYGRTEYQEENYLKPTIAGDRKFCFALTESSSGSDARHIATSAVRRGADWIIKGEKTWISGGEDADYAVVMVKTVDDAGEEGVTAFIVDRDMGWKSTPIPLMGSHPVASLYFDDVVVPDRNILGEVNEGFRIALGAVHRSRAYLVSARNIGASKRLLEMATDYACSRETFGRLLSSRENIQWMLAESEVQIRAAQGLVLRGAVKADRDEDYRFEAAAAKLFTARMANEIADRTMQIFGAAGYAKGLVVERYYRDLRVERIYEGSDEMVLSTLARGLVSGKLKPGGFD
jgi:alkylation response protein AidB-like acyl-CoA dehydrogenase